MASQKLKKTFFDAVSKGSMEEVQAIVKKSGLKVASKLAVTFNDNRETPLLLAIKAGHTKMVEYLLDNLKANPHQPGRFVWKGVEYTEAPPLFAAAVSAQVPDFDIIDALIHAEDKGVDFLEMDLDISEDCVKLLNTIAASSMARQQKIDVLELIGAVFINRGSIIKQETGVECWKLALRLRESNGTKPELQKNDVKFSDCAVKVCGNITEFDCVEELHGMALDGIGNYDWFINQGFIVARRVMRRLNPDPNSYSLFIVYYHGNALYTGMRNYVRAIHTMMLVLEHYQPNEEGTAFQWPYEIIETAVNVISASFQKLQELEAKSPKRAEFSFANIMKALDFSSPYTKQPADDNLAKKVDATIRGIFNMTSMIVKMLPKLKEEEKDQFKKWLSDYIGFINGHPGVKNLLHFACAQTKVEIDMIKLFLNVEADPNGADAKGDTPLHSLANNQSENISEAALLLLDAGGRLDKANAKGETAEKLKMKLTPQNP